MWIGLGFLCFFAVCHPLVRWLTPAGGFNRDEWPTLCLGMCWLAYIGVACFTVGLQTIQATSAVASERERNTLDFLLLLPVERSEILWIKWAPWIRSRVFIVVTRWRCRWSAFWCGVFPLRAGSVQRVLLPWPTTLFISTLGLLLSVVCRRVVTANVLLVGILLLIFLAHLLFLSEFGMIFRGLGELLGDDLDGVRRMDAGEFSWAIWVFATQQCLLVVLAVGFLATAFRLFSSRTEEVRPASG